MDKNIKKVFQCYCSIWLLLAGYHIISAASFNGRPCQSGSRANGFGKCLTDPVKALLCLFKGCPNSCIIKKGLLQCTCPYGYKLQDDLKTCVFKLITPKKCIFNYGCSHGCILDIKGVPLCTCPDGYKLHNDLKKCVSKFVKQRKCPPFHFCSHSCLINAKGFPQCTCPDGFRLDDDKRRCILIIVKCSKGLVLHKDNKTCIISDLMVAGCPKKGCSDYCQELDNGQAECFCPEGFALDSSRIKCIFTGHELCKLYPYNCQICMDTQYAPHPTACSKYLQCDLFHRMYEKSCPPGTIWSQEVKTCVVGSCK